MATVLLVLVVVLVVAALIFGVVSLLSGEDPGLAPAEPDGRAAPLPNTRSLTESDLKTVRFDVTVRGYRMAQVDRVLRRTAYDVGYKDEMIAVLEAEVGALREGRRDEADQLRKAREAAASPSATAPAPAGHLAGAAPDGDGTDDDGTDRDGADRDGADRDGTDRDGADRDGTDRATPDGDAADRDGADRATLDGDGTDRDGPDRDGPDRDGPDRDGPDRDASASDDAGGGLGASRGPTIGHVPTGGEPLRWAHSVAVDGARVDAVPVHGARESDASGGASVADADAVRPDGGGAAQESGQRPTHA